MSSVLRRPCAWLSFAGCTLAALCVFLPLVSGCTPVVQQTASDSSPSPIGREPYDYALLVAVDKSGSFVSLMRPGGKGLEFLNDTITHYFHGRLGNNDCLIVTQLSGNRQALLWQGSPRQMRNEFSNSAEFSEFIEKKSDAAGSRIWDGISDTLELAMSDPNLWNGRTKLVLACLTDMENNLVDSYTAEKRLMDNLKAFAKKGGVVGLYFVGTAETTLWRKKLSECGFRDFVVEPSIASTPRRLSFE